MAFWQRKRGTQVVVYSSVNGKQKALPRHKTKHLDAEPDHNVQAWVDQYERQYEKARVQEENIFQDGSALDTMVRQYVEFMRSEKKSANTVKWHDTALRRDVIPFFLHGDNPLRDPQQWPGASIRMHTWLRERAVPACSTSMLVRANIALRGFYQFHTEEGLITNGVALKLRAPKADEDANETPLQYALKPDEVLEWALAQAKPELKLIALLGYFLSLRPYEIFGAQPGDFRAGSPAETLECSLIIRALKTSAGSPLFHRLAFHVVRQRTPTETKAPKSFSKGWVACFDERAARLLVPLLRDLPADQPLIATPTRTLFALWREAGIPDVTIKDLRRASLYHLGHHTTFDIAKLQKHARHKYSTTTEKYLRQPGETVEAAPALDLDA